MRTAKPRRPSEPGSEYDHHDLMSLPWRPLMLPLNALRQADRKTRTHSKGQIQRIADSILHLGFINPVVVDRRRRIVAGHGRFEAAKLLGLRQIPVICVEHLSDAQLRAYSLADNKLAERAGWDREALAVELEELQVLLPEIALDLTITGFEPGEVDALLLDFEEGRPNPSDLVEPPTGPAVSRSGDLFVLGKHRLIVGDARQQNTFDRLMRGEMAEMAFLDPPYNVRIVGHAGSRGRTKHREFFCASGEMSPAQFESFLQRTLGLCARYSIDGSIHYVCMDWRHAKELLSAGAMVFDELKNICVWTKTNAGQGSFYRNEHELVFVYKHGEAPHLNTFGLGAAGGRTRSNVWRYAGANTFRAGRMDELTMHPTVKPIALVADALRDCSRRGSIVLDAFAGSGTTILAAEQIGRRAFCIEIDPAYADVSVRRWQRATGRDAVLEATGQVFDDLLAERCRTSKAPHARRNGSRAAKGVGDA